MQVGFLPYKGIEVSSARIRCFWVAKYWKESKIITSLNGEEADVFILQKCFKHPIAEQVQNLKAKGKKLIWDLCDPDWWLYPNEFHAIAKCMDAIVCCNQALAEDFRAEFTEYSPWIIPDRHDPEFHATIKIHNSIDAPIFVWFGWSQNRVALYGVFDFLEKLWARGSRFKLLILDEDPYTKLDWFGFPVMHKEWSMETFHQDLLSADIALLPPYPGLRGQLKSDNKKTTAMWAGLPVTDGSDYFRLKDLIGNVEERRRAGFEGRQICEAKYDVRQSVEEWRSVIANLYKSESKPKKIQVI